MPYSHHNFSIHILSIKTAAYNDMADIRINRPFLLIIDQLRPLKNMNNETRNILIVEDNPFDFKLTSKLLTKDSSAYSIEWASTLGLGFNKLESAVFDVILLDLNLPDSKGIESLITIRSLAPTTPVIILTSQDDEQTAVMALKTGAQDYLIKGKIEKHLLERSIRYSIERQQAALRLKSQNDFLMSILESLTHPFIVVEAENHTITIANTAARKNWFMDGVCCNASGNEKHRPYLCGKETCPVQAVRETKKPVMMKNSYMDDNGITRTNEIHAFPVLNASGDVKQVIIYFLDISEQENSKREYQRLSTVVHQSSDSILIMDTEETIQYVNPAFELMTGYSGLEIIGRPYSFLASHKHSDDFFRDIRATLKSGKSWSGIIVSRKKDDTMFEEEVVISPVKNEKKQIINYVLTSRDITAKKRLESIAEAANLMTNIGYIFSGIRHEIGNPINSIKMALTVLNTNMENYSKDMIKEFTERALDEVLRVEYLLRALKNFSMFENLEVKKISLNSFIENFISLIKDDFKRKGISISSDLPSEHIHAYADPRALHQVILNIVTNAADSFVSTTKPSISFKLERKTSLTIIEIKDNGCGMTQEERSYLFKPFYTSKRNGTGLGLVIVKKMLSKMNSTIKIISEKDKGTNVMIFIPEENLDNICQKTTPYN